MSQVTVPIPWKFKNPEPRFVRIVAVWACAKFQADRWRNKKLPVDFRNHRCPQ